MRSPFGHKEKDKVLERASKSCQSFLDLRGQNITSVPREVLTKPLILNLRILELSYNGLQSIPREICYLVCLEELYLGKNDLKTLPRDFDKLSTLKKLSLVHNGFQEIPFCLSHLLLLEWLNFSGNVIEIIPPWLLCLPHLRHLYILYNLIENIPREVYIHGIEKMCKYFRIKTMMKVESKGADLNYQLLLSPTRKSLPSCKVKLCTRHQGSCKCDQDLSHHPGTESKSLPKEVPPASISECLSKNDLFNPAVPSSESPLGPGYLDQHQHTVSGLMASQLNQLNLIKEQREKILLRQEIRKLNIDYLQQKKNQHQPEKVSFSRRKLDFSLDLENLGKRRRCMTTSEYGTCSSFTESADMAMHLPLLRKDSFLSYQSMSDDAVNNNKALRIRNLSSDDSSSCLSDISDDDYDVDSEVESLPDRRRHITLGDICVIIPEENLSGYLQHEFTLDVVEDVSLHPKLGHLHVVASEVIEMEPHGARFYEDDPAVISLPCDVKVGKNDHVICLCSDTGVGQRVKWERMSPKDYNVFASHVEIKAYHFSLFAVVVSKGYPEARKTIRAGVGGCLYVSEVPGVEVLFPETSLLYDIEASIKVLYADKPYNVDHSDADALALATPVVKLGPHGCVFNPDTHDFVTVRLPLPDGKEIQERYGDRQLTFICGAFLILQSFMGHH
ncbi:unnamed protein product [Porites evermanni]|uniref:Uncharacterized protein n=1 Tax=Porites evermanni TaxID=104178 RepID=A0ABN8LDT2_9CNID|nr:unnamed protein product [Porites evermanni]